MLIRIWSLTEEASHNFPLSLPPSLLMHYSLFTSFSPNTTSFVLPRPSLPFIQASTMPLEPSCPLSFLSITQHYHRSLKPCHSTLSAAYTFITTSATYMILIELQSSLSLSHLFYPRLIPSHPSFSTFSPNTSSFLSAHLASTPFIHSFTRSSFHSFSQPPTLPPSSHLPSTTTSTISTTSHSFKPCHLAHPIYFPIFPSTNLLTHHHRQHYFHLSSTPTALYSLAHTHTLTQSSKLLHSNRINPMFLFLRPTTAAAAAAGLLQVPLIPSLPPSHALEISCYLHPFIYSQFSSFPSPFIQTLLHSL